MRSSTAATIHRWPCVVVERASTGNGTRLVHTSSTTLYAQSYIQAGPQIGHQNQIDQSDPDNNNNDNDKGKGKATAWMPGIESALATGAGIILLAFAGLGYHKWYKWEALRKMKRAFAKGYDPVLELASASKYEQDGQLKPGRVLRKEQEYISKVINGEVSGEYLLLMGPKGVGKTSMILDAMIDNEADGCAMLEAHEDPEVVRLRLGKALDFEYNEDSFAGLFSRKDPREAGPRLDIERALAKLEKVAIRFRKERGRPMVLVVNNVHFLHDDDDGHALLHMLQQRAEAWAGAGVLTMVFSSDDFHIYRSMKKNATRMHVLSIRDLTPAEIHTFLSGTHKSNFPHSEPVSRQLSNQVWDLIGGRLSFLARITKHENILQACQDMIEQEMHWLHHKLGLIPDHDDDVMDEQKVSSCSFLLFQAFAKLADEAAERRRQDPSIVAPTSSTVAEVEGVDIEHQLEDDLVNVLTDDMDTKVSYREAREIMTRPDYMLDLDHHNIINIDVHHQVRPDSRLMLSVFRRIANEPDFQDKLDNVRDRIDQIESLHRTAELTVKSGEADLGGFLRLSVGPWKLDKKEDDPDDDEQEGGVSSSNGRFV
ncbi:hypothetical protein OIO90_004181 [Microbotryomycetes sp. JL221]|nr:hypothetical protein OIO90_004181 [Microbotryomycetes sp. JL221]